MMDINKNINTKQKLSSIIFLIMIASLVYFIFSPFHLKDNSVINWYIPLVLTAIFSYLLFSKSRLENKLLSFTTIKIVFNNLVFYLSFYFVSMVFVNFTIPSIYTSFAGSEFIAQVHVIDKIKRDPRLRGCSLKIHINLFDDPLCTSQSIYNAVKVGDKIVLKGTQSRFGFKINAISKNDS